MESACRLLCLLNLSQLSAAEVNQARKIGLSLGSDWKSFFEIAAQNSAWILTAKRLKELGLYPASLPQAPYDTFLAQASRLRETSQARTRQAAKFLQAARDQQIEVIVLKGGLLGSEVYGDPDYKKMNDADILIRKEDAPRMIALLKELGYVSVGPLFGQEEIADDTHHCPPFVSPDLKCMVGIHWGLCSPYSVWKPGIEGIWKRRASATSFGAPAYRMSWEETLLHLCIHLPFFKIGVRELADVYNLTSHASIDWNAFDQLTREWKAQDAAWRVLSLASRLHPIAVPQELLANWKEQASSFTRRDTERRLTLGHALIATRSVQIGKIEKAFAVFKMSPNYRERVLAWAATWVFTFWPKRQELPRLIGKVELHGPIDLATARVRAGIGCWNAMARDYGQTALSVITLINIGIVLRDTARAPFRAAQPSIRDNPHFKLLEALE